MAEMKVMNMQVTHEGCQGKISNDEMLKRNIAFQENKMKDAIFCPFCNEIYSFEIKKIGELNNHGVVQLLADLD